ncbi:acetyltransferase [Clostridium sp. YIM B02515]|uniref:Acetyltransferase n=1 Tax=Clostridium rhizosphaerae TaxID=2803861 RepID=A0ABS1TD44_9CLOT|nr:acyltransferase family protein [Clostridium rhizosphaerae]MBL4937291.1 acetyltransferase [Clostridium rhizosphaerae]
MLNKMQNYEYITGIDGLRALAVIAVVAYHFSFNWAKGGFLGVDIFFVISGYLITSKILSMQESNYGFSFKEFLIGRIKRLLPAAYTMIITTFMWVVLFNRKLLTNLIGDAISSIMYASNWWFIFHKLSYFDSFGSPSPLKNLWSLAIEEQFYIVWPILLIIGLKVLKKRDKLANIVFIGALCSAILMGIFYIPGEDPSRVYYGTDTRAFELLIGSWLAIICPMERFWSKKIYAKGISIKQRRVLNITGTVSLAIFILSVIFMNEYRQFLYRGGMLLFCLNAALLIVCVCHPACYLGCLFSWKPLRWVGKRSYGIYLWHYPIIVLSTPVYEIGNPSYLRVGLQLTAILIVSHLSYSFVEMPIRKHEFKGFLNKCSLANVSNLKVSPMTRRVSAIVTILIFLVFTVSTTSVLEGKQQAKNVEISQPETAINNAETNSPPASKSYKKILAIGDSIMLDITPNLKNKYNNITIDGKIGRQVSQAVKLAPSYEEFNDADNAVIIELGTNAYFTDQQINELLNSFSKAHIYLVNVRVPRQWENDVNKALEKKAKDNKNITLTDWHSAAINHPEYFSPDGVHLQPKGAEALTSLIDNALKNSEED